MNLFCKKIINIFLIVTSIGFLQVALAQSNPPKISIIIDDLGYDEDAGMRIVNLPGPVVCSILPDVEFSKELAVKCHERNKEIILHTPMEALTPHRLGPGGLYVDMDKTTFLTILNNDIKAIPFVSGLNNHEGSRLTSAPVQMQWLMQDVKPQGLFFIDSVTSAHSVAEKIAKQDGVPTINRNVFLDDIPTQAAVRAQFALLLQDADQKGQAVAIGHPYPATITVLQQELPRLAQEGYELVPISQLILKKSASPQDWQLPFLRQIWQQITANHAGFDPMALLQAQMLNVVAPAPKRIPIVAAIPTKPLTNRVEMVAKKIKPVIAARPVTSSPTVVADAATLLHTNFCAAYPNLCYLLPSKNS